MTVMTSPYKNATDSPSRQLLYELSQLCIANQEDFYARLDRENKELEAQHVKALAAAAAKHDRIRKNAENVRAKVEQQLQIERQKREDEKKRQEEKKRELERIKREKEEEAERTRLSDLAKAAELEKKEAEQRRVEIEKAELKRAAMERQDAENARQLKEKQEAEAREKERLRQAEQAAKEAAIAARRLSQSLLNQPSQPNARTASGPQIASETPRDPQKEAEHKRYLEIHQTLKNFRKFMTAEAQKQPAFKQRMGDMRREIVKCVGQLIEGKGMNRAPLQQLMNILRESQKVSEPTVDITMFIPALPRLENAQTINPQVPALFIYLINIFSKAVVSQFINEAGVSPKAADPIGITASHIFSHGDFRWHGISMVGILFAKMHVVCPVLFGINGDESTLEGKTRIGWSQADKDSKSPTWISSQSHYERMTGLGAGFASLALRNYEKTKLINPIPNDIYWESFVNIINLQAPHITQTHYVVLKAMLETQVPRYLEFWGDTGRQALRVALIDFPTRMQPQSVAAKALAALADVLRRDNILAL